MSVFELYLIFSVIPALGKLALLMLVILTAIWVVGFIFSDMLVKEQFKKMLIITKVLLPLSIMMFIVLPSERQIKYIIGGSYVTNIENIENIEKLPPNVVDAANKFLEKMSEESNK